MANYADIITSQSGDLPLKKQKEMGKPVDDGMSPKHRQWVEEMIRMSDAGEIDVLDPDTLVNRDVYEKMTQEDRGKVDLSLSTMANQLRHIEDFYRSDKTPNACTQLQIMIDHFWAMRDRLEEHGDVFKF